MTHSRNTALGRNVSLPCPITGGNTSRTAWPQLRGGRREPEAASHTQSSWVKRSFLKRNQISASPCLPHKIIFKHVGKTRKKSFLNVQSESRDNVEENYNTSLFSFLNCAHIYFNNKFKKSFYWSFFIHFTITLFSVDIMTL